jgi:glycosyltransferase involved in cell wall biosynthesis
MNLRYRAKASAEYLLRGVFHRLVGVLRFLLPEVQAQHFLRLGDYLKHRLFRQAEGFPVAGSAQVPDWVVEEMRALASIEPGIYPSMEKISRFRAWQAPVDNAAAQLYRTCLPDFLEHAPDMVFLVPHLQRGGADLGIIHHVRLCVEQGLRVTVVTTRDVVSPWINRLPDDVRVVEYGRLSNWLGDADRRLVLIRLLLQCPSGRIHLINSQLGWELLEIHGRSLVAEGKRVYASVFCDDLDQNSVRCGYASDFLPRTWMYLAGLFSDNQTFLDEISRRDGIPRELMHLLYFPTGCASDSAPQRGSAILWASRISAQKGPDLLYEIALALPTCTFDVYGEWDASCSPALLKKLKQLPNVRLQGRYDSFEALTQARYHSMLLYTSRYDGLPNVLLEATAAGLPIVAADVGGIGEFIQGDSSYLVPSGASAESFVAAINEVLAHPAEAGRKVARARERLVEHHSWNAFSLAVRAIPGYIPDGLLCEPGAGYLDCERLQR